MMGEALHFCGVGGAFPASALWAFLCHHQAHVEWIGCSLHDLIQPGFSFLVGAALPFSLAAARRARAVRGAMIAHAFRRALILVVLGHRPPLARPPPDPLHLRGHPHPDRPRLRVPLRPRPAARARPVDRPRRWSSSSSGRHSPSTRCPAPSSTGAGAGAGGLAAPPDRVRGPLEQERELRRAVRPVVPEPVPAGDALHLQRAAGTPR